MIKDKVELSNDFSSINKKCFGCRQFNHIIEECPKVHYIPNTERILKSYLWPSKHIERSNYIRKRKKINSFKIHKSLLYLEKSPGLRVKNFVSQVSQKSSEESSDFAQEVNFFYLFQKLIENFIKRNQNGP
jgi:hypothetical protein